MADLAKAEDQISESKEKLVKAAHAERRHRPDVRGI